MTRVAPNLHPDEPAYVTDVLAALQRAGVGRVVYDSVASPYAPELPHHLAKARSEVLVRRSGLDWTILQPGAYLQNLDLSGPVEVPYSLDVTFGFLDLADLGHAAAVGLTEDGTAGRRTSWPVASRRCASWRPRRVCRRVASSTRAPTPGSARCSPTTTPTACRSARAR